MRKNRIIKALYVCLAAGWAVLSGACSYLDVDPELGMTEKDVFGTYKNFKAYFDGVYNMNTQSMRWGYPSLIDGNSKRWAFISTTDAADAGRYLTVHKEVRVCALSQSLCNWFSFGNCAIVPGMFRSIRIANMTILHIDDLTNASEGQKYDLLAQAYFVRAYCHLVLVRYYGGMPYVDKVLGGDDEWDLARLPANETLKRAADDFLSAYTYFERAGTVRRDPGPGRPGHLQAAEMDRPNGAAALGLRARCLLYAASPLNNIGGKADWEEAAEAAAMAIRVAEAHEYAMLPLSEYRNNFFNRAYTNEELWSWNRTYSNRAEPSMAILTLAQAPNQSITSGICPTQNFVDRFETRWGDALNTEEDRIRATAEGHFNEQDPYADRDPRLDLCVVHDGSTTPYCKGSINFYYDPDTRAYATTVFDTPGGEYECKGNYAFGHDWNDDPTSTRGHSYTGYMCNKFWRGDLGVTSNTEYIHSEPLIRMAELYLNYAEAANEAFGPLGSARGISLTALDALNKVRARAEMPPVQGRYTSGTDALRERIINERCVELAFEGHHYWFDIRRWMIAPQTMSATLYGIYVEKVPVSPEYPIGRRFERRPIPAVRQTVWKDCMYWWPWPEAQAIKMKNFVNNMQWQ